MNIKEITQKLVNEKNLDAIQVEKVSDKIETLPEDIRTSFEKWLITNEISSPTYEGYDVKDILKVQPQLTILAAYLTLDWLRRDPKAAKKALQKTRFVKRIVK